MREWNFNLLLFFLMSGSRGICIQGELSLMGSVLVSSKDNLLLRKNWTKRFNSWLMTNSIVREFFGENKGLVWSAKWWTTDFKKRFCRSFIYNKSKGPNAEPCGTPQVTILILGGCPGKLTYCFLFLRNDFNQLLASPRIP